MIEQVSVIQESDSFHFEENISDDQENMRSSNSLSTRNRAVNEMQAKLGGAVTQNAAEIFELDDISQGLKPSATNFSKELSQETVSLYQQILESSEKNF